MPRHTVIDATGLWANAVRVTWFDSVQDRIYLAQFVTEYEGGRLEVSDISGTCSYRIYWRDWFDTDYTRRRFGFPPGVMITPLHNGNARYRVYSSVDPAARPRGRPQYPDYHQHTGYGDVTRYRYIAFEFSVTRATGGVVAVTDQCYWYSSIFGPAAPPPRDVSRYTFEPDRPQE